MPSFAVQPAADAKRLGFCLVSAPHDALPHLQDQPSTQAFLLAALTAGGGITGYARTGSVPSIAAGVTVGLLYGLGGLRQRNRQPYGLELALLASVLLAGSSVPRAIKTQKALPVGLSVVAAFGLYRFGTLWRAQM
ncbi:MAG: hypothetical protein Q9218_006841 [Villophora microphyllina]